MIASWMSQVVLLSETVTSYAATHAQLNSMLEMMAKKLRLSAP